ncbi:MAG: hypothetical protein H7124_17245 [Phycisphaerales bacterium]|nr:hypothetical protein [Hyphomonadaceae bacterium]
MEVVGELQNAWNVLQSFMLTHAWATKLVALTAFILVMVTIVAWLYSGEIQNTEYGPLALRGYDDIDPGQLFGPRAIVTNLLDGKKAHCSVWVNYKTRGGTQVRKRLWRGILNFGQVGKRYSLASSDLLGLWNKQRNETVRAYLSEAGLLPDPPSMFADSTNAEFDIKAASKDADYEVVAISTEDFEHVQRAHTLFLESGLKTYATHKTAIQGNQRKLARLHESKLYKDLPDVAQEARIYMRMRFDIFPWYVLTKHPDREIKTTAWLTVLTSLFAIFMQVIYNGFG